MQMSVPDDAPARELLEHGRRDLERRFDPELDLVCYQTELGTWHDPRDGLWYALCLLLDGEAQIAERIISQVMGMQEQHEGDAHRGNFRWLFEDEVVTDLNAVEFVLEGLVHILLRAGNRLSDGIKREVFDCMRLAFEEVDRLDVHWTYTNIYLLDVMNSILGGEILGDARIRERGLLRLRRWAERTRANGAPHEFNSPTYSAVQITALAALGRYAEDGEAKALALEMEQFLWRHVASHFHAPTLQLAGPHSRAYRHDVTGAPGLLKVVLYRLLGETRLLAQTPYYSGPGREGDVVVALTEYHCPRDALAMFRQTETREVQETPSPETGMEIVTYLTPEFALGTMSYPYGVGDPPEPWPQHNSCILYYARSREPGYGVLYCRYLMNEGGPFGSMHESGRTAVDRWDLGVFRTAQRQGDAIIVYGVLPYLLFPVSSLRLDVRLLGPDAESEVLVAGQPYRQDAPMTVAPGASVGIADGEVYIGLRPLERTRLGHDAPIIVWPDGQETVLSMYNYRGPAKVFWEHRTLSGPFFKGNVCNGFALRVAPRREYGSLADFVAALERTSLSDEVAGSRRRITFGAGEAGLTLEYDLRDMQPLRPIHRGRRREGATRHKS
jgi:hypothetical protein